MESAGPDSAVRLGRLAHDAQEVLHDLGLSTALLDALLKIGMGAGACGGKLSGAGGGGAFVLFCRAPEDARRVRRAIVQDGPDVSANMQAYHWNGEALQSL
jgi:mevalonate kinase